MTDTPNQSAPFPRDPFCEIMKQAEREQEWAQFRDHELKQYLAELARREQLPGRHCAQDKKRATWRDDPKLRTALEDAGWRYATLTGIVDPEEDDVPASVRASDREKYGHMIRRADDGGPLWVCKDATTFVCELTGVDRETATEWLDYEWHAPAGEV